MIEWQREREKVRGRKEREREREGEREKEKRKIYVTEISLKEFQIGKKQRIKERTTLLYLIDR